MELTKVRESLEKALKIQQRWFDGMRPTDKYMAPGTVAKATISLLEEALKELSGVGESAGIRLGEMTDAKSESIPESPPQPLGEEEQARREFAEQEYENLKQEAIEDFESRSKE